MNCCKLFAAIAFSVILAHTARAQQNYEKGIPGNPKYSYLDNYDALKDYIDRSKYPNFKLGVAVAAYDYINKGTEYRRSNANFTEVVAGNEMKYASVVGNDGSMNFSTVRSFVKAASDAGQNIYGHTLAWHSQQNTTFLNGLIKDKPADRIKGDTTVYADFASKDFRTQQNTGWKANETQFGYTITFDNTDGLHAKTKKRSSNYWDVQYVAMENIPTDKGGTCTMFITLKGSGSGKIHSKLGDWNSGTEVMIPFTTEWKEVAVEYGNTIAGSFLLLQHGDFVGDIYIRRIRFATKVPGLKKTEERRCLVIESDERKSNAWDNQFWVVTNGFSSRQTYTFSADIRADKPATVSTQIHNDPSNYAGQGIGDLKFTTEWKHVSVSGSLPVSGKSIAFNLNELADANRYYLDNVSFIVNGKEKVANGDFEGTGTSSFRRKAKGDSRVSACTITERISYVYFPSSIPLTDKEKHDTLVWAMDRWIKGMMEACNGKVKAWDVVNEAISGGWADSEGVYPLQHGGSGSSSDFFWQDHMGDLEYVRQAVRLARKYGPANVKLFINDYNLESDWDGNAKLKSLIKWIQRWEADGVTHIDGIGSQMHVSCYMDAGTQASKRNGVENMLRLMAASGKLVRISELDMGMVDASGNDVPTADMTEEMHAKMADYYEWIVKKYLEIIPVEQQWGICQWCATDAPEYSGWRAGSPVGLWTLDGYRKHAYGGFVKGLGGVSYSAVPGIPADIPSEMRIYDLLGRPVQAESVSELPEGVYVIDGRIVKI